MQLAVHLESHAGPLIVEQKSVCGNVIGGHAAIQEMLDFAARHGVKPKTERMPMTQCNAAITKVGENKARYRMVAGN
ncbi:MAG TPA: hypothetical protein VN285_07320 [Candidatus Deferrimicrobium sp.]|nr:hypothetical protein [Candidatus Deferrimicrobium sp.]